MEKTIKVRGILPPGIDKNSKTAFGIMWIRLGRLLLSQKSSDGKSHRVLVQFWGEKQPVVLQPESTPGAEYPRMHEYEIRCPVLNFQKYLLDMKNNLKIEVEGEGAVSIDFKSLLVKNANHTSKSAFDHFKSNFAVLNRGKKVGTLDIEMASNFNPKILEVEVEQQSLECRNAVDLLAVQKPWALHQFLEAYDKVHQPFRKTVVNEESVIDDKRIPNSLNTQPPEEEKFNPQQYKDREESKQQPKLPEPTPPKQRQRMTPLPPPEQPPEKQFPALEKILTYSNLKLRDEAEELRSREVALQPSIKLQESPKRKMEVDEEQIRRNQQLRKQFYGEDDTPRSQELEDIIASVPKSEQEQPRNIFVQPQVQATSSQIREEEQPKVIPVAPTPTKPLDFVPAAVVRPQHLHQPPPQQTMERVLLTLYAQLHSIKLNYPVGFHLMYKSYGQAERTRIDCKPNQPVTIVSVVGTHQLKIMDRVPFIVEVWDTRKNAFIGLAKVNLSKVKQGFLLGGQHINEKAVRANLLPTTVFKGTIELQNLKQSNVGEAWIQVLIGTSNQISTFLNESKSIITEQPSVPPTLQPITKPVPEGLPIPSTSSVDQLELFTEFIDYLRVNHNKITPQLLRILSLQQLTQEEFAGFLSRINRISFLPIFNLLNYKLKGSFPVQLISDSFDEYSAIWTKLQSELSLRMELLRVLLNENTLSVVEANSQFNLISKDKFIRILSEYSKQTSDDIRTLLRYQPEEFISTSKLRLQLSNRKYSTTTDSQQFSKKLLEQVILGQLKEAIQSSDMQPSDIVGQFRQTDRMVSLEDLSKLFRTFKIAVSFWRLLIFVDAIKQLMGDETRSPQEITYASFYNWFSQLKRQGTSEEAQDRQRVNAMKLQLLQKDITVPAAPQPKPTSDPTKLKPQGLRSIEENKSSATQNDDIPNLGSLVNEIMEERGAIGQRAEDQSPSQLDPAAESPKARELAQTTKRWRHSFTVEPTELVLEKPAHGSCCLSYRFPHQDQHVEARQFPLFPDKHRYELKMLGKHSVVLEDPLASYIADEVLTFQLLVDGKEFAEAAMPAEEYLIQQGTETKILALFGSLHEDEAQPSLIGKLRVKLSYSKEPSHEQFVGRQTTTSLFLPRSGNLNVQVSCSVDMKKLATELKVKEDFYCSLQFELFPQSRELQHLAKTLNSKLHASLTEVVHLRDSLKLKLTPAIIEYLKGKNCRITLQAVYYQRMEGVPKKQQLQLGAIDIPLLAVVTGKGIHGDYAFKNKYGLFVALAQCSINYGRNAKLQPQSEPGLTESQLQPKAASNQKIWLLLNFLEVLQYGEELKHITFEVFHRREKHTSARCTLHTQQLMTVLRDCTILLQLTQQELYEQTFLTINVKTSNHKNNLHLEVSTRPLLDALERSKHTAYGGYFVVAEDHKDILPVRVGLKIVAVRGSNKLKDFVVSLQNNPQTDVFEQLDLPSELDNYPKMVELFRNALKLPKAHFEEYMEELLGTRERLNIELFTTRIYFRLDLSQLRAHTFEDIARLLEGCPQTEVPAQTVVEVLQTEDLQLINFKPQFLGRFTFKGMDHHRLDRNAELFELTTFVDVLVLARKIEVLERRSPRRENSGDIHNTQMQENTEQEDNSCQYLLRVAIEKGKNIESLYNGIKPNSLVRCPLLELETEVVERESNPEYNLQTELQLQARDLVEFKKLDFQIFHRLSIEGEGSEEILIGHGRVDISSLLFFKGDRKSSVFTVLMTPEKSYMKNVKAELRIICQIQRIVDDSSPYIRRSRQSLEPSAIEPSGNYDMSRIARILKEDVKAGREMLFESSDEDE